MKSKSSIVVLALIVISLVAYAITATQEFINWDLLLKGEAQSTPAIIDSLASQYNADIESESNCYSNLITHVNLAKDKLSLAQQKLGECLDVGYGFNAWFLDPDHSYWWNLSASCVSNVDYSVPNSVSLGAQRRTAAYACGEDMAYVVLGTAGFVATLYVPVLNAAVKIIKPAAQAGFGTVVINGIVNEVSDFHDYFYAADIALAPVKNNLSQATDNLNALATRVAAYKDFNTQSAAKWNEYIQAISEANAAITSAYQDIDQGVRAYGTLYYSMCINDIQIEFDFWKDSDYYNPD